MNENAILNTSLNKALQQLDGLTPLMKLLSFLGNEEFFLLLLPLFYLCLNRRIGLRLGAILLLGDAFNSIFKIAFALPRPYWIDNSVRALSTDTSFGMPSSHAQNAAAVWGFLASQKRSFATWIGAVSLIVGIAISRVFLGVHFGADVLIGIAIGAVWLGLFLKNEARFLGFWQRQSLAKQIMLASRIALGLLGLWLLVALWRSWQVELTPLAWREYMGEAMSPKAIVARGGALWGLLVGAALLAKIGTFETDGAIGVRVARFIIALIGIGAIWLGLGQIEKLLAAPGMLAFRFARYALLTLWVVYFAPRVLMKLGLLKPREETTDEMPSHVSPHL